MSHADVMLASLPRQAKKFAKLEMKAAVDEFEKQLTATHVEKKEDWTTAQNAARRAAKGGGGAAAEASQEEGERLLWPLGCLVRKWGYD